MLTDDSSVRDLLLPAGRLARWGERLLRCLPRTRIACKLAALQGIEPEPGSGHEWRATTRNPVFDILPDAMPTPGWYCIECILERHGSARVAELVLHLQAAASPVAIPLPATQAGVVREVVRLPAGIEAMQWRPMNQPGRFRQSLLLVHRIGFVERHLRRAWDTLQRRLPRSRAGSGLPVAPALMQHEPPGDAPATLARPLVSVIIPTRDQVQSLKACLDGLLGRTNYPALEVIVVDNQSTQAETLQYLDALRGTANVRILSFDQPFNFSAICNEAAQHARGDVLALLNNDVEVIQGHWLEAMVRHAVSPGTGAVGACLLYPDGGVQHAGITIVDGLPQHRARFMQRDDPAWEQVVGRAVSCDAVTGACMVLRKSVWLEAGGMDAANFPVDFSDVDLCLRIHALGYRIVYEPQAELIHHESLSRGTQRTPAQRDTLARHSAQFKARWGARRKGV